MGIDILSIALDALLVVAIAGLWMVWFQQAGQRKNVENMLKQASEELQQATQLLDHVMNTMAQQKESSVAEAVLDAKVKMEQKTEAEKQEPEKKGAADIDEQDEFKLEKNAKVSFTHPQHRESDTNYSAQVMRLNREGLSAEAISEKLSVPIAQVKLLLLLQVPKV